MKLASAYYFSFIFISHTIFLIPSFQKLLLPPTFEENIQVPQHHETLPWEEKHHIALTDIVLDNYFYFILKHNFEFIM